MAVQRRVLETNCVEVFKLFSPYPNWRWSLNYINIGLPDCIFSLGSFWSNFSMGKKKKTVAMLYWNKVYNLVFVNERSWVLPSYTSLPLGNLWASSCFSSAVWITKLWHRTRPSSHPAFLGPPHSASVLHWLSFPPTGVSTENVYQRPIFRRTLSALIRNSYFHWISQKQNQEKLKQKRFDQGCECQRAKGQH